MGASVQPIPSTEQIKANLKALRDQQAPEDVIDRYMASVGAKPVDEPGPERPKVGMLEGLIGSAGQGASLGASPKLLAGLDAFGPTGLAQSLVAGRNPLDRYRDTRDNLRGRQESFEHDHPTASAVAEFAGGALPGVVAPPMGLLKAGALFGGASALGHGEGDLVSQAKGVTRGAGLGALGAGIIGGTGKAAGRLASSMLTRTGLRDKLAGAVPGIESSTSKATQYVQKLFGRDAVTEADAATSMTPPSQFYGTSATNPQRIADLGGENVRRGLAGLQAMPGATAQTAKTALTERRADQFPRIMDATRRILNVSRTDADRVGKELVAERTAAAKPAYDAAYSHGMVDDRDINRLMTAKGTRPYFVRAYKMARKVADLEGQPLPQLRQQVGTREGTDQLGRKFSIPVFDWVEKPDVRTLDYIKRELDGMVSRGFRNTGEAGMASTEANALRKVRDEFLGHVDRAVPAFKAARAQNAGAHSLENALENGQNIFKGNTRLSADDVAALSKDEKEMYLVGAFKAIRDRLSVKKNTQDLTSVFDNPDTMEQLQQLAGGPKPFQDMMRMLQTEQGMAATEGALQGSRSIPLGTQVTDIADEVSPDVFSALGSMLRGKPIAGAVQAGRALWGNTTPRPVGSIADEAGKIMMQTATPGSVASTFAPPPLPRPPVGSSMMGNALGALAAPQLNPNAAQARDAALQLRLSGASDEAVAQQLGAVYTPDVVKFVIAATPRRVPQ